MTDRAHTPGPWTRENDGIWAGYESDAPTLVALDFPYEADARLAAAAPDMLEALEHIALQGDIGDPSAMIDIARAALSKALGEPNPVEGGE